jgi:hypothetical protein
MSAVAEELARAISAAVQDHVTGGGKPKDFERVAMLAGFKLLAARIERLEGQLAVQSPDWTATS